MTKQLILASGSPRRKELLGELGYEFTIITSAAEEIHDESIPLRQLCEENAKLKGLDVAKSHPEAIVLSADTLVYIDDSPLGKPTSIEEAKRTLAKLSGRTHHVCTGMCLIEGGHVHPFSEVTEVIFKKLDQAIIGSYVTKVNVMDKAGSYAIQEHGEMIVERIAGDYSNVVGLPQARVIEELLAFGLQIPQK